MQTSVPGFAPIFADEHRLTIKPTDWPAPFVSYQVFNNKEELVGYIGKNTELDDKFFVQLYEPDELNSKWAAVKRPQPIWMGSYKTVPRCLYAASCFLSGRSIR
jgi:hypothetical protein